MNKRIFIERKKGFDIDKRELYEDLHHNFNISLPSLRYVLIYDIFGIDDKLLETSVNEIFTEKNRDFFTYELPKSKNVIAIEFLPGQFDQRADSAEQCIKLIQPESKPIVKSGTAILFDEDISNDQLVNLKKYLINAVESREKNLNILELPKPKLPNKVPVITGFINASNKKLKALHKAYGLAMSLEDLIFIQKYFETDEKRDPSETELKVLDTYWSDHCRHTTFETEIKDVTFTKDELGKEIEEAFNDYIQTRKELNRDYKPVTLMDIATINTKYELSRNNLNDLEISEEVNAASIYIDVDVDGIKEKWLLMFKNETHNHPTEIAPFGGASTCIGGAIRDPLSGRSYVYSAMRVTGAADITEPIDQTIPGKLPQRVISKGAAHGYSSYGNQIGLATTFVDEIYHHGYKAKRMEIGAVIGAVKADHIKRETPQPGDIILLLGGKTGRDGIGGATGSSKEHTVDSIEVSSAEVQKGNAPEERKIQRLFRNPKVTTLIKKSNDFGAGGVSVAIGELADGLIIDLNKIPTKYDGMDGTELAISESQERMAVVLDKKDVAQFKQYCNQENIEVVKVAEVIEEKRLIIKWNKSTICNMSREFIETSGVRQSINVEMPNTEITPPFERKFKGMTLNEKTRNMLKDKNISSKQGLVEMFDSTIGRTTVLSPFGGKHKLTKTQTSIHKLPVRNKNTNTVSMMAYGYNPYISEWSPYHGSTYAILESMAKIVASGGNHHQIRFTFQEFFERLNKDPLLWSKPLSALLGAYKTLKGFNLPAIGGKDSMSGTYHELTVPPTLVSFAVCVGDVNDVISPEFKSPNNYLYFFNNELDNNNLPNIEEISQNYDIIHENIKNKNIVSAYALTHGGLTEALIKSSFGNKIGVKVETVLPLFKYMYGAILVESKIRLDTPNTTYIGRTTEQQMIQINDINLTIDECIKTNQERYNEVYPIEHMDNRVIKNYQPKAQKHITKVQPTNKVNVLIPVFPGTNCEYDCEAAFTKEGATVTTFVFNNQNEKEIIKSIDKMVELIDKSHIIMLAGGFSSGDEPDGSGKFIASVLRNEKIKNAIDNFLSKKHLILGICNGFQALVKSGLLPYGEITPIKEDSPTLFKNAINRHIARFVNTKVSSTKSPWLSEFDINENHTVAMSHGEGQFIIDESHYHDLLQNNQIAFQYVDDNNNPTYHPSHNPNGSSYAIEGIISEDGLILGKMGHSERYTEGLFKNIDGNKTQNIFKNGVQYFKG